ncbi:formamidopyrimidine-DNA glycosylase-like protein [Trifolium pratense]|uniref:Formamidopyrimidine-DNA glycosylase-like protein n=1 Tax=Trifolium pratense TaxID=57577 RepID=A0A2K3MMT4_TRIPR|nr:formamidopyrimidine-DNA glycosylase-like protein [Trifolium pratense]
MLKLSNEEAARKAMKEKCIENKISKYVVTDNPKTIKGVSRSEFEAFVVSKTTAAARLKGKNMWIQLYPPSFSFLPIKHGRVHMCKDPTLFPIFELGLDTLFEPMTQEEVSDDRSGSEGHVTCDP